MKKTIKYLLIATILFLTVAIITIWLTSDNLLANAFLTAGMLITGGLCGMKLLEKEDN